MTEPKDLGVLRAIREDELGLMLSWRNAPKVRENMYTRHEISMSEHQDWWGRSKGREDQRYFMLMTLSIHQIACFSIICAVNDKIM